MTAFLSRASTNLLGFRLCIQRISSKFIALARFSIYFTLRTLYGKRIHSLKKNHASQKRQYVINWAKTSNDKNVPAMQKQLQCVHGAFVLIERNYHVRVVSSSSNVEQHLKTMAMRQFLSQLPEASISWNCGLMHSVIQFHLDRFIQPQPKQCSC